MAQEYSISSGILDKYQGSDTTLVVPEGVTEIAANVFSAAWNTENVHMISKLYFRKA